MPTQLDNTWLPPETRTHWDGSDIWWPFDYGSGEYNRWRMGEKVFNGRDFDRVNWNYWGYEYSTNIRVIIEHYETWAKQHTKELQKITDGKITITIDDLLWYLRYEKRENVSRILGENIAHYTWLVIKLPTKLHPMLDMWYISHTLIHSIKRSIDELRIKK